MHRPEENAIVHRQSHAAEDEWGGRVCAENPNPDVTVEIAARLHHLVHLRHLVYCMAEDLGFSAADATQLEMCVDEACSNSIRAIQDKEGENAKTKVRIDFHFQSNGICITIYDNGSDFSNFFENAEVLTEIFDCKRRRGYGLQIIKTFMDEVRYVHTPEVGNRLRLTKYLPKRSI